MDELEYLRKKRMKELMQRSNPQNDAVGKEIINQHDVIDELEREVPKYLQRDAWSRLTNIKIVNPDLYLQVLYLIFQLGKAGRIKKPMCEDTIKKILNDLTQQRRETKIIRR